MPQSKRRRKAAAQQKQQRRKQQALPASERLPDADDFVPKGMLNAYRESERGPQAHVPEEVA